MNHYDLGNRICSHREALGLTQAELGRLLGVSGKAVSKWENGQITPKSTMLTRLAEILGMSIDELLTGKTPESPPTVQETPDEEYEKNKKLLREKLFAMDASLLSFRIIYLIVVVALTAVFIARYIALRRWFLYFNDAESSLAEDLIIRLFIVLALVSGIAMLIQILSRRSLSVKILVCLLCVLCSPILIFIGVFVCVPYWIYNLISLILARKKLLSVCRYELKRSKALPLALSVLLVAGMVAFYLSLNSIVCSLFRNIAETALEGYPDVTAHIYEPTGKQLTDASRIDMSFYSIELPADWTFYTESAHDLIFIPDTTNEHAEYFVRLEKTNNSYGEFDFFDRFDNTESSEVIKQMYQTTFGFVPENWFEFFKVAVLFSMDDFSNYNPYRACIGATTAMIKQTYLIGDVTEIAVWEGDGFHAIIVYHGGPFSDGRTGFVMSIFPDYDLDLSFDVVVNCDDAELLPSILESLVVY